MTIANNISDSSNKRTNFLILGIFFLFWSINGYFIGGNVLKMALLFLGFGLILMASLTLPKYRKFVNFGLITFSCLIVYWFIAIIQNQKTVTATVFLFDVICYLLLLCGYIVANNLHYFEKASPKVIAFISLLAIVGAIMFIKYQSQLLLSSVEGVANRSATEEGDDNSVNVIGIAYTNALVFFILYYFMVYYKLNKWIRAFLFLSVFCVFFVILSTQSRGALIYIVLILVVKNFSKIFSVKSIFKSIKIVFVTLMIFLLALTIFPVMQEKLEGTIERFQILLEFSENADADKSSNERALMIKDFFDNIEDVILLGKEGYSPYPHNQFLEILMRWGFFFGLPMLFFSIKSLMKAAKLLLSKLSTNSFVNLILLLFMFCFLQSLSSMSLEMNRMLWFGFGFVAALPKKIIN